MEVFVYRIRDWETNFENNRTREIRRLEWVRLPTKMDGDGYTELLDHKDGAAHYGVWVACVAVASKCNPRGALCRDGGRPHDPESLARITRMPAAIIAAALTRLVTIGWVESDGEAAPLLASSPREEKRRLEETRLQVPQEPAALPQEGAVIPQEVATLPQEPAALTQDAIAKRLRGILGSSLNVCRDQVRSLARSGMPLDAIDAAVDRHGAPGVSPWEWTKAVTGRNGSAAHTRPDYVAAAERFKGMLPGKDGAA